MLTKRAFFHTASQHLKPNLKTLQSDLTRPFFNFKEPVRCDPERLKNRHQPSAHLKVVEGLLFRLLDGQGLSQVPDVVDALELRDAGRQHHGEQGDQEVGVPPQSHVGLEKGAASSDQKN